MVATTVLVEGVSDRAAVEALAAARGRDLAAEGVRVVDMGGATNVARHLASLNGQRVAGLCDVAEERFFRRGLERAGREVAAGRAGLEAHGFFVCVGDLEDELIRALGAGRVVEIVESQGELGLFRTLQKQPAQRERSLSDQLHRFMGTRSGRKEQYAAALASALDARHVPAPLDRLLRHV